MVCFTSPVGEAQQSDTREAATMSLLDDRGGGDILQYRTKYNHPARDPPVDPTHGNVGLNVLAHRGTPICE